MKYRLLYNINDKNIKMKAINIGITIKLRLLVAIAIIIMTEKYNKV